MIDTIISSSVLILIILAIRLMFKGNLNPMVQYGLWILAAIRLAAINLFALHPVESIFSVMNAVVSAEATIRGESDAGRILAGYADPKAIDNAVLIPENVQAGIITTGEAVPAAVSIDWQLAGGIVWGLGTFALIIWFIYVNLRFGKNILRNRMFLMSVSSVENGKTADEKGLIHQDVKINTAKSLPVYVSKGLDSPCLMGLRGEVAIYVPSEIAADQEKLRFAIAHERCHYKHHDLIWAIVRNGLVAFYWFNPFVWVAAVISKRDSELACDYSVLKEIGKEERLAYGRTLIDLIRQNDHKRGVFQMATTMYGSANGIKERIAQIARNKKMKASTMVAVLLIAILAVGCTFTAAPDNIEGLSNSDKKEVEAFAMKWADAFSDRDAKTIHELSENEEVYLTIGNIGESGEYWMGWSSPWPWDKDYVIEIEDDFTIHIYYYFRTSEPSIYVAKETIILKKIDNTYKAAQVTMKHFDNIGSKADFDEAYKFGFPDFMEFAAAYQDQADQNAWDMTSVLENPVSSAIHQLNLKGTKISGTYVDQYAKPPMAVVKLKWADGEAEVSLIQPMLIDDKGAKRQASVWIAIKEDYSQKNPIIPEKKQGDTKHLEQISVYMEEQSKMAFSPYYELLDFVISNYQEEIVNGNTEAVFNYKIIHKNYDKDPDTVEYIKEAKERGNKNYQQMYDEYLQPQEMNFHLKVVIDVNNSVTLYSNISPVGVEWEKTKMTDFILK